jgi:tRNA wybutosine-synthesizing protein 3
MVSSFDKRKQDVLSKLDKSHKNSWDEKIVGLCKKINSLDNYYTTSSCSGRVVLMIEQDKKGKDLFVYVYHDKVSLKKLKEDINSALKIGKKIKFKLEPCILHVSCRSLEDAERLYGKAKLSGWKKSGIIGIKNGFSVEMNSSERLEFPIISENRILVNDKFLKIIVDSSNSKLEKSWLKIQRLQNLI